VSEGAGTPALTAGNLVRLAAGGNADAFEQLIRRMERRVYGFAFQHLRDAEEAHDLAQEIFVKLYRNLGRYDPDRPFEPWFWKLAANTTINYRRRRVPLPIESPGDALVAADAQAATHDPGLVQALTQLDDAYRVPVLLHYYSDLSLEQVAVALNLTVPAIKSRLHRARAQLRNFLAEAEEREVGR